MKELTTLNDIAKRAGVAKSTVSRYLNNGSVSDKTREKIQAIIEETGYVPNQFAQSLKAQHSNMIGVVLPRFDSPSTNQVLKGIDDVAHEKGYQLMLTNSNLSIEREKENISLLKRQKVGGIILIASKMDEDLKKQVTQLSIPTLILGQKIEGVPSLVHQDYEAGRLIAEHALELGHTKILYVGVTEEDNAVGVLRRNGFMDTVKEAGFEAAFHETSFSRKEAYQQALDYLPTTEATYIAAATDHIAIGILNAANELNLSVPDDFSLSGFGGYSESDYTFPSITTIDYPFYDLGIKALNRIEQMMKEDPVSLLETLPNQLNVKQSTKKIK